MAGAPAHLPRSVSVFTPCPPFQCLSSQGSVGAHLFYLPSSVPPRPPAPLTGLSFRPSPVADPGSFAMPGLLPGSATGTGQRDSCGPKDQSRGVRGPRAVRERRLSSPSPRKTSLPSSPQRRNHLPSSLNSVVPAGCPPTPPDPKARLPTPPG